MSTICFLRFGPTSSHLGNRLDPWWYAKRGYRVLFWELSGIYYDRKKIEAYFPDSDYKFKGPNHKIFYDLNQFYDELKKIEKNTIFLYGNRNPFYTKNDVKFLNLLFDISENLIPIQFDTFCRYNNAFNRFRQNISFFKHNFLSRNYKFKAFIGCGAYGRFYAKKILNDIDFISIPSPQVLWKKEKSLNKKKYGVFVDESFLYQPDAKLHNLTSNKNIKNYYDRMLNFFNLIEKKN